MKRPILSPLNMPPKSNRLLEQSIAQYEYGKCLICNTPSPFYNICIKCVSIGFVRRQDNMNPLGFINNSLIIHTVHIGANMPEVRLKGFLQSLKLIGAKGIIWTDSRNIMKLDYEVSKCGFSNICDIRNIESLSRDFLNEENTLTYLNCTIKRRILSFMRAELNSTFGKIAYAVDILRMIILQQYGGFYIDSNVRIVEKNKQDVDYSNQKISSSGVMYLDRNGYGQTAENISASSYVLYEQLTTKPDNEFYPQECSAIYANKGNIFFDFVLYNFFNQYLKDHIFSGGIVKYNAWTHDIRVPSIINCMMIAQYLMEIKFNLASTNFTLKTMECTKNSKNFAFTGGNYISALPFLAFGYRWEKHYSHSHKANSKHIIKDF